MSFIEHKNMATFNSDIQWRSAKVDVEWMKLYENG